LIVLGVTQLGWFRGCVGRVEPAHHTPNPLELRKSYVYQVSYTKGYVSSVMYHDVICRLSTLMNGD
jgi:hypothetical protein